MRAVILAGGSSTRFWPFNQNHKSLIEIGGLPLIARTINNLPSVDEVVVVEGPKDNIKNTLKKVELNKEVEYRVQNEPRGMWDATLIGSEDYGDDVLVLSGHQFSRFALGKLTIGHGTKLLLSSVTKPGDYGVVSISKDKVTGVIEKPENPSSNIIINSAYRFSNEFIRELASDSKDDHYKLERVLANHLKENPADFDMIPKEEMPSLKYPWDALSLMERVLEEIRPEVKGTVSENAELVGEVYVDEGASIMAGAKVYGPAYIGKGVVIGTDSLVRQSSLEMGSVAGFGSEVARSLIGESSKMHHSFIGDSVVGKKTWFGFGFITANRRFDKKAVVSEVKEKQKDTNRGHFGCAVGDNSRFGINSSTMPGIPIGSGVTIGPNTIIRKNIPDGKIVYVKQDIVIK